MDTSSACFFREKRKSTHVLVETRDNSLKRVAVKDHSCMCAQFPPSTGNTPGLSLLTYDELTRSVLTHLHANSSIYHIPQSVCEPHSDNPAAVCEPESIRVPHAACSSTEKLLRNDRSPDTMHIEKHSIAKIHIYMPEFHPAVQ